MECTCYARLNQGAKDRADADQGAMAIRNVPIAQGNAAASENHGKLDSDALSRLKQRSARQVIPLAEPRGHSPREQSRRQTGSGSGSIAKNICSAAVRRSQQDAAALEGTTYQCQLVSSSAVAYIGHWQCVWGVICIVS